jgi:putative membrane protein insertion efficiency factor
MEKIVLKLIRFYQKTLSPDHGKLKKSFPQGFCRYSPTCSEYTYQSVEKFGLLKGGSLGFWRILRCNPFSHGGPDPVQKQLRKDYFVYGLVSLILYFAVIISLIFFIIERSIFK